MYFPFILLSPLIFLCKVSAMISSSGELRFLSEPTLSDTEPELTQNKWGSQLSVFFFFFLNKIARFFAHACESHPDFSIWKGFHYCEKSFFFLLYRPRKKKKVKKAGALTQSAHCARTPADPTESANSGRGDRAARRPLPKRPMGRTNGAFVSDA